MNYNKNIQKLGASLVMAAALTFVATTSLATVRLVAIEGIWKPAVGSPVTMWGFKKDFPNKTCAELATAAPNWKVGPELTDADLQTPSGYLRIKLRNCLTQPVSIIIPGQTAIKESNSSIPKPVRNLDGRITSFTNETPPGGTVDYLWKDVVLNQGTFLYTSGTHPALQVHMGLYGALKVGTYPATSGDITLLYSEIDPALHAPPTAATPLNYKPSYYLVNGEEEVTLVAGDTTTPTVLSFLNAGLDFHVPAINGGGYMSLVSEDGNTYPYAKNQYSANIAAGKTIEALWQPTTNGSYVIYDRRGNGMNATLTVGP